RGSGAGRALLDTLARQATTLSRGAPCVLAAEVLEPNPAHSFYARVGYAPVAWSARIATDPWASGPAPMGGVPPLRVAADIRPSPRAHGAFARLAAPDDALAVAMLDAMLAARRRAAGDVRFDRPRAVDATMVGAIAAHLAHVNATGAEPTELVAVDPHGVV